MKNQSIAMSADVPPPPYSSLYPPTPSPYGPMPPSMTSNNAAATMPAFAPFYHQNGTIASTGHLPPPQQAAPAQLLATPYAPLMTHSPTLGHPSPSNQHHQQIYGTIAHQNPYLSPTAAAQPYGFYQTAIIPTAYGPIIAPIQLPPMNNSAAAAAAAAASLMLPTAPATSSSTNEAYFDPRSQHYHHQSRTFEMESARQTIPIPSFGHIPTIPQGNMALMYGNNNGLPNGSLNNGHMLGSKSKKPFY